MKISTDENFSLNRQLKILQITTIDLTAYCFYLNWFKFLKSYGFDVTLATTVQSFRKEIESTGARVIDIPMARNINPFSDLISTIRLYNLIRNEKFDIVQTYTTKAGFLGRLAARLSGVPVIIHNMLEPPHNATENPLLKKVYINMERLAGTWAHHIFTTTSPNVKEILENNLIPREKLTAIPEGLQIEKYANIDVDIEKRRMELGIDREDFLIVTVARLETPKGHIYLMEAAREILKSRPHTVFLCVGKGELENSLKQTAVKMGISKNFRFLGFREDMLEILKCCDLFVLPSLWEGQGVAIMEAMALKKGVVACRVGGVVDVVEDGVSGILVEPRNPEALQKAISELADNPERVESMGKAGYKIIITKFDEEKFNHQRMNIVHGLIGKYIKPI